MILRRHFVNILVLFSHSEQRQSTDNHIPTWHLTRKYYPIIDYALSARSAIDIGCRCSASVTKTRILGKIASAPGCQTC